MNARGKTCIFFKVTSGYTYNDILFSLKRSEILTYATTWMNLENMLGETSHSQKNTYYRVVKFIETESRAVVSRGQGGANGCCLMNTEFLGEMMKQFWRWTG